ncbi:MAG TPA: CARDB domain-containing protein [Verrucomicrobiae bacterium]
MKKLQHVVLAFASFFVVPCSRCQVLPDLVPAGLEAPTALTGTPGPTVTVAWSTVNQGSGSAVGYWNDAIYLSYNPWLDGSSAYVGSDSGTAPLAPGESYRRTNTVTLPVFESGIYYLFLKVNAFNYLQEASTANNALMSPFAFTATPADLAPLRLIAPAATNGPPKPYVTIVWGVTNSGPGAAIGSWNDTLYFSTNSSLDASALEVWSPSEYGPVPAGGRYWRTNQVRLPATQSGAYYLIFKTDSANTLHEAVTANNVAVAPIQLYIQQPDLAPLALVVPAAITSAPNPTVTLRYAVTNLGPGAAVGDPPWNDTLSLSTDAVLDTNDKNLTWQQEWLTVPAGGRYWRTNTVTVPVVSSGTYYLILKTDASDVLYDANPANNTLVVPVEFTILPPDLVPVAQVPATMTGPPYPPLRVVSGATNQGIGPALGYWSDTVYFATNAALEGAIQLWSAWLNRTVPAGSTYWETNDVRLPVAVDGTYYLGFRADTYGDLVESDRGNNLLAVPFTLHIEKPDLAPMVWQVPAAITSPPNPVIWFVWAITNQGAGAAIGYQYWDDQICMATNPVWTDTATRLNEELTSGPVAPGRAYWRTNGISLPIVRSGTWYFFFRTDAREELIESNDDNNMVVAPITFTIQPPDLVPQVAEVPREYTGPPNPKLTVTWAVTNQGPGLARTGGQTWYDGVFFSTDAVLDSQDLPLTAWDASGPLAAGAAYRQTNTFVLPVIADGTFYLIFKADRYGDVYEDDKTNNIAVVPVTFTIRPSDLVPVELQAPALVMGSPFPTATIAWRVQNQGTGAAAIGWEAWVDTLYLSRDTTVGGAFANLLGTSESGPLPAGEAYWRGSPTRLPVAASTNVYLVFETDHNNVIFESNENNNTLAVPIRFEILSPDLTPLALQVTNSYIGPPNPTLTFAWGVTNRGAGAAEALRAGSWLDRIYFSTNSVFDGSARFVAEQSEATLLPAGRSYWRTNSFRVPVLESGTYYVFFLTDDNRAVYESDFANNMIRVPVTFTIQPPDLAALALDVPPVLNSTPKPQVTVAWGVTNQGIGRAEGAWRDILYFSTTPTVEYNTPVLREAYEFGPIQPGETYWRTNVVTVPVVESGTYYLIFVADYQDSLSESDLDNNLLVVPVTFNISPPDLVPFGLDVQAVVAGPVNPTVTIAWGITNQGSGSTAGFGWNDRLLLGTTPPPENGSEIGQFYHDETIEPGQSIRVTNTLRVPVSESGTYYLTLVVNRYGDLFESSYDNNEIRVPITFQVQPPDLAPIYFKAPAEVTGSYNPAVRLTWGVTNQGPETARGFDYWHDNLYLSADPVLDPTDRAFGWNEETGPITPRGNYWRGKTVNLPVLESGAYYLILSVDDLRDLHDLNYSNNTAVVPIQVNIQPPDLVPLAFNLPSQIDCSPNAEITLAWGVTNAGSGAAAPSQYYNWCDRVYLSRSPDYYGYSPVIDDVCDQEPLAAGEQRWRTNRVKVAAAESGTYYFVVEADYGNVVWESSETNNLLVSPVTINVTTADLTPLALEMPPAVVGSVAPTISVVYTITNRGPGAAIPYYSWYDTLYVSRTNVLDGSEAQAFYSREDNPVAAGEVYRRTNSVRLPVFESGSYYLILRANYDRAIPESDYSNNVVAFGPIPIEIRPSDVFPIVSQMPSIISGGPNPRTTIVWGITNQGPGVASTVWGSWRARVYLSTRPALDPSASYLAVTDETTALAPGEVRWITNNVRLPVTADGAFYFLFEADGENALHEINTNNNLAVAPVQCTVRLPDLATVAFLGPASVTGQIHPTVELIWGVTNQGAGPADTVFWQGGREDVLWLSRSTNFDNLVLVDTWEETNSVAPGSSYWRTNLVRLPVDTNGTYFLQFIANSWSAVAESNLTNNVATRSITVDVRPPDLAPLGFTALPVVTGMPYPTMTVVWGVTNCGIGPALPPVTVPGQTWPLVDAVYLSRIPELGGPWLPAICGYWQRTAPFEPGASEWHTNVIQVPVSDSGTYYLIFATDAFGATLESNELNNTLAVPVTFYLTPPPDLAVSSFLVPREVTGPGNPTITAVWHVVNEGIGPIAGQWFDRLRWAGNMGLGLELASYPETHTLMPGEGYWRTNTITLPVTESGDYYLSFYAGRAAPADLDLQNNQVSATVTVNITGPPVVRIADARFQPGGTSVMSVFGVVGASYQLQASSDLVNWTRVLDFVCAQDPTTIYDFEGGGFERRFYRVGPIAEPAGLRLGFAPWVWATDSLWLKFDGPVGRSYRVEASADLVSWTTIANLQANMVPMYFRDAAVVGQERRFYRAVGE